MKSSLQARAQVIRLELIDGGIEWRVAGLIAFWRAWQERFST